MLEDKKIQNINVFDFVNYPEKLKLLSSTQMV